jgi:hypothetical protein
MGGVLAALQFSFTHYWMNSYWGGSLAAIGGCLVLGALPRLKANARPSYAMLFALGLMILANTRPFEGLMLSLAVAAFTAEPFNPGRPGLRCARRSAGHWNPPRVNTWSS